jgi:DNA-binding NtrC family response regulator
MELGKTILIIDDETDLCLLLKDYFVRKSFHVFLSNSLAEGRKMLSELRPDILFLDNNLPDGLGWKSAPEIALNYPNTYIVLISAFHPDTPVMPENARYKIIEKPLSLQDLDKQFA